MKGHVGAVITSGLAAIALALALLQAAVLAHSARPTFTASAARGAQSNRYSVPGGRSGIPWPAFDEKGAPVRAPSEGRTPDKQPEERRTPPAPRRHGVPPAPGPHPARRAVA